MKCIQHILLYLPQTVTCFCNKKKLLSQTVKTSLNFQIKIIITKVKKYTYNICIKNILRAEARVASRIAAMNLILLLQLRATCTESEIPGQFIYTYGSLISHCPGCFQVALCRVLKNIFHSAILLQIFWPQNHLFDIGK